MSRQHQIPTTFQEANRIRAALATALQRLLAATDHRELPALQQEARELIDLVPYCLMQIHEEQRRLEREPPPRFVVGSSETIQISAVAAKLIAEQTLERFGIAQLPDKFFEELAIASDRFLGGAVLEVFREQAGLGDDAVPSRVPDEIPNVTKGGRK